MWLVDALTRLVNTGLQMLQAQSESNPSLWMYAVRSNTLSWVFGLLVGLVLMRHGDRIARAVFPKEEGVALDVDVQELQTIGFSMLAAYFALAALRGIVVGLYGILTKPPGEHMEHVWERNREHFVGSLVELVAAVLLFFGTPALVRFMRRLQEPWTAAGTDSSAEGDAEDPKEPPE